MAHELSFEVPRDESGPGLSRAAVRDTFAGRICERELEDLRVIVSELTTNALLYGAGEIHLHVLLEEGLVTGEVFDEGTGFERAVAERGIRAVGGNGLHMVGALAERWGIHEGTSQSGGRWRRAPPPRPSPRGWGPSAVRTRSKTEPGRRPALPRVLRRDRATRAGDGAVVVEAQQRDHVGDVVLGLDLARGVARLAGEDRVVVDPAGLVELVPDRLREAEVQHAVAVQMADLAAADRERELAARADAGLDARPGRDLLGDPLAGVCVCSCVSPRARFD